VTIVADAGFGKSTLLASWAAERPCAWCTLAADDHSLAAMTAGLVDALRLQVPALSAVSVAAVLEGPRGPDADAEQPTRALAYAALLADALEQHLSGDLVLVLDDVQEISSGDPAARLIEGLIRVAPPLLHVVLASRTPPQSAGSGCAVEVRCSRLTGRRSPSLRTRPRLSCAGSSETTYEILPSPCTWP